jgi:hypothetical protein
MVTPRYLALLQWEQEWQMEFHGSKCQLLRITNKRKPFARDYDIHGHKLEEVESAKYLGVTIQKNLSWLYNTQSSANSLTLHDLA